MIPLTAQMVEGLVGSCLIHKFDNSSKIPPFHREIWEACCSKDRFVARAAPRGHAKSTSVTLSYTLAAVLFRNRKFVLLVSDTESQAAMFLGQIKQELQDNADIVALFGLKKNDKGEVSFKKDSETDIIVEFDDGYTCRIIAKGAEQKLRGLLWNGTRPDLIVIDDLENDEIVMNQDRRYKFKRWFYSALLPCRSQEGVVRYIGTVLHMDSMLQELMPKDNDKFTVQEELKTYSTRRLLWNSVKYKAHNSDFSAILWPERYDAKYFKELRDDYSQRGLLDAYSQEYLNDPIDATNTFFKKSDFQALRKDDIQKNVNFYIAADLAIGERQRSDYTVFAVGAVDSDKVLQVRNIIRDRMDGMEIVQTILMLQRMYEPAIFAVEEGAIQKAIGPFLREEMLKSGIYVNLELLKPSKDKAYRARAIQARMRAGGVKFDKDADWYPALEDELMKFPRDRHDDQVDAMSYLGSIADKMIQGATQEEMDEDEYEEFVRESRSTFDGRSSTTGY